MDKELIFKKFGGDYLANEDTYHMGIHHLLAEKIAQRFPKDGICLDACLGAGFMAIPLAKRVKKVIGVDINAIHLKQARQNAGKASAANKIEFIEGDILQVIKKLNKIDAAFLDPDWARVGDSKENHVSDLSQMVPDADVLLSEVRRKTENICLRLPKSFVLENLGHSFSCGEIESVYLNDRLKFHCIYFGNLAKTDGRSELRINTAN